MVFSVRIILGPELRQEVFPAGQSILVVVSLNLVLNVLVHYQHCVCWDLQGGHTVNSSPVGSGALGISVLYTFINVGLPSRYEWIHGICPSTPK